MAEKKMVITVDYDGRKESIECDGIVGICFSRTDDGHLGNMMMVGNITLKDMLMLHKDVENRLLPMIKQEIHDASPDSLGELLAQLL